jgi:hypothetical protein
MTTLADSVVERVVTQVTSLKSVQQAAELSALVRAKALPQRMPAAFVLPLGFDWKGGEASSNQFTGMMQEMIGIVLIAEATGDVRAEKAAKAIDALKDEVVAAVAGWAPDSAIGVFEPVRGRLVSVDCGTVFYQIDFCLLNQLRIAA